LDSRRDPARTALAGFKAVDFVAADDEYGHAEPTGSSFWQFGLASGLACGSLPLKGMPRSPSSWRAWSQARRRHWHTG